MDSGKLVENGAPRELTQNQDGAFYSMRVKAGTVEEN